MRLAEFVYFDELKTTLCTQIAHYIFSAVVLMRHIKTSYFTLQTY